MGKLNWEKLPQKIVCPHEDDFLVFVRHYSSEDIKAQQSGKI